MLRGTLCFGTPHTSGHSILRDNLYLGALYTAGQLILGTPYASGRLILRDILHIGIPYTSGQSGIIYQVYTYPVDNSSSKQQRQRYAPVPVPGTQVHTVRVLLYTWCGLVLMLIVNRSSSSSSSSSTTATTSATCLEILRCIAEHTTVREKHPACQTVLVYSEA